MCRHLGWLGAPRTLAALMLEPPHGLATQSYAPRRQAHGLMNADGWGVGFYTAGRAVPARWRSDRPLWSAASFASVAPVVSSHCVVAAVRSATVGMPGDETASAPFTDGTWLVSHNGRVRRDAVPTPPVAESWCDSALLAAHVLLAGPDRLADTVRTVAAADPDARLNLLLADGDQLLATTWGDTLSVLETDDGVALASEPWDDDPRWRDIPDRHLVHVDRAGTRVEALEVTA
uniref:Gamma-glutamyl-hercynylcysteine sulfoxide hydrolase n=1 Tax=uncultured Nocardioidaceae bacterium TaxID=253824 RepID=A0A6J4KMN9_9ACTN|nr:MAG: Amidohydrolase EgtC (hercynylcysteine sulfoxide synthase) [uncultured Nocardioidaceae bacterium]